jgi:hypothetical protein
MVFLSISHFLHVLWCVANIMYPFPFASNDRNDPAACRHRCRDHLTVGSSTLTPFALASSTLSCSEVQQSSPAQWKSTPPPPLPRNTTAAVTRAAQAASSSPCNLAEPLSRIPCSAFPTSMLKLKLSSPVHLVVRLATGACATAPTVRAVTVSVGRRARAWAGRAEPCR